MSSTLNCIRLHLCDQTLHEHCMSKCLIAQVSTREERIHDWLERWNCSNFASALISDSAWISRLRSCYCANAALHWGTGNGARERKRIICAACVGPARARRLPSPGPYGLHPPHSSIRPDGWLEEEQLFRTKSVSLGPLSGRNGSFDELC